MFSSGTAHEYSPRCSLSMQRAIAAFVQSGYLESFGSP